MGYNSIFTGSFSLDRPLTDEQYNTFKKSLDHHYISCSCGSCNIHDSSCRWEIQEDQKSIKYIHKYYYSFRRWHHIQWIHYIIDNFIHPWGYLLNGEVSWQVKYYEDDNNDDEDDNNDDNKEEDQGFMIIENNQVNIIKCSDCRNLRTEVKELQAQILTYEQRLQYLETHLQYMPNSLGALEAKAHFLSFID